MNFKEFLFLVSEQNHDKPPLEHKWGEVGFDSEPSPRFTGNYYWSKGVHGLYKSFFMGKFYVLNANGESVDSDIPVEAGMYVIDKSFPELKYKIVDENGKLFIRDTKDKIKVPEEAKIQHRKDIETERDRALSHFFPKDKK